MPVSRTILAILLALAIFLPVAQGVLFWVANLLAAMDDSTGASFAERLMLGLGVFWVLDLILLLVALGMNSLASRDDPPQ